MIILQSRLVFRYFFLKIEAHFRRRQEKTEAGKMISGDIVFIAGEMKVLIKSREISLTKTELKMLTFFSSESETDSFKNTNIGKCV